MKRTCFLLMLLVILTGCAEVMTFETVGDDSVQTVVQTQREMVISIPEEACAIQIRGDAGIIYLCDGFSVAVQVFSSGDLGSTVQTVTGFSGEDVAVLATASENCSRYACGWSAAGEQGEMVGQTVILDDGLYHYCLSVMADAATAAKTRQIWQPILDGFEVQ